MSVQSTAIGAAERWYRERYSATPERRSGFTTLSGEPVRPLYTPADVGPFEERIGFPGEYPASP